jgi:Type II CAAX prenyl endopeptidase Rce1-like
LKRSKVGLIEALAFSAAVLAYIWVFRFRAPWTLWLLVAWAAVAYTVHRETPDSTGLSMRCFLQALADWRYLWPGALLALGLVLQQRLADPQLLARGGAYFVWCCVQQAVYQNLVYRRLRASLGTHPPPWLLSGMIFGLVHWPNPVLVPVTAVWGALSSYLFERWPSVPALALVQFLFSTLLYELTPWDWHHGFRVGPRYDFP